MNTFISGIEQFHFIRPEWLLSLPIALIFLFLLRREKSAQHWSSYIPKEMLTALQSDSTEQVKWWKRCLLILCIGSSIAAAGPSWHKQSVPIIKNQKALVLLLDLSPSMLAQDLNPDRLTRAKYKLIDLMRLQDDGQIALIAYAGEAHTVSPLSDDPRTIEALLPALHPSVMPVRGSNTEAAIELAQQLLSDAGLRSGDIMIITDGIANDAIADIKASINSDYRVSILAVGSNEAAPIPAPNGGFVRKINGEIVLSEVNSRELRSMAGSLGGHFAVLTNDDSDIETLLKSDINERDVENNDNADTKQNSATYDAWVDMGPWLILLMLPFILVLFRKGVIYLVPFFIVTLISAPNDAYAADASWRDLWKTRDQQGAKKYQDGEFKTAADTFKRKDWSALASYQNGNYEHAISQLSQLNDVTSLYNKGNALAFNSQLEQALEAYAQVLEQQPGHEDALHNTSVVKQLLNQQDQQKNQDSDNTDNQEQSDNPEAPEKSSKNDSEQQNQEQEKDQQQGSESQQSKDQTQPPNDQPQQQTEPDDTTPSPEQEEKTDANAEKQEESDTETENNNDRPEPEPESPRTALQAENVSDPLKDSSEQWLRTIRDDPSGLLRRKFDYQTRQRAQQGKRQPKSGEAQDRY